MVGVLAKDPSLYADLVPRLSNYNYISLGSARNIRSIIIHYEKVSDTISGCCICFDSIILMRGRRR